MQRVCLAAAWFESQGPALAEVGKRAAMGTQKPKNQAEAIFAEHDRVIRAMIRRHTDDPDEQEDIYQNLYLTLVCKPVPCPTTNVLGYLDRVIRNDVIDAVRRRRKYADVLSTYAEGLPSRTVGRPEDALVREEQYRQVRTCIQSLPQHEATAVVERFERQRSIGETARHMGLKERTISRYVSVALSRIRESLQRRQSREGRP